MNVAYVFATTGRTIDYVLGEMILPQLEADCHGVDVAGMFFFRDNTFVLRDGDPLGARLVDVAEEKEILLMLCDRCAETRGLAERVDDHGSGRPQYEPRDTFENVTVGCFPDLYGALGGIGVDHVITL
jgi:sulfur relay (sulfurtransferase) complex TusBCD TusD component (DsrE family)